MKHTFFLIAVFLLCASSVLAQTSATSSLSSPPPTTARITVITLGADTIEGDVKAPAEGIVSAPRPRSVHRTLVKPRIDFRRELLSSVASL